MSGNFRTLSPRKHLIEDQGPVRDQGRIKEDDALTGRFETRAFCKEENGMIWKISTQLGALALMAGFSFAVLTQTSPVKALDIFDETLDKREGADKKKKKSTRSILGFKAADFKKLSKKKNVYIDLKIRLDGKTKYSVLSSEEEEERRYNVDCRAGAYGRFPMGSGTEYYVKTGDSSGQRIDLSIFPGSRSENPDNDISCVADRENPKSAILRIRGIYKVLNNDFGDRLIVELRPIKRNSLSAAELAKLP